MTAFPLKIVTPDGIAYDGTAEELIVRTTTGDLGILAGHINCVAPLGMGRATILSEGKKRYGACIGGILAVHGGEASLVASTFEWAEDIDLERAQSELERRKKELADAKDEKSIARAKIRVKRELIRTQVKTEN